MKQDKNLWLRLNWSMWNKIWRWIKTRQRIDNIKTLEINCTTRRPNCQVGRVFANDTEDLGSIPRSRHTKDFKNGTWYLLGLALNNIRYVSKVKWSNSGKEGRTPLHLGVVAIEKGAFWSPTLLTYMYINFVSNRKSLCVCIKVDELVSHLHWYPRI